MYWRKFLPALLVGLTTMMPMVAFGSTNTVGSSSGDSSIADRGRHGGKHFHRGGHHHRHSGNWDRSWGGGGGSYYYSRPYYYNAYPYYYNSYYGTPYYYNSYPYYYSSPGISVQFGW